MPVLPLDLGDFSVICRARCSATGPINAFRHLEWVARLAFLNPAILRAIMAGTQPKPAQNGYKSLTGMAVGMLSAALCYPAERKFSHAGFSRPLLLLLVFSAQLHDSARGRRSLPALRSASPPRRRPLARLIHEVCVLGCAGLDLSVAAWLRRAAAPAFFHRDRTDGLFEVEGRGLEFSAALPHWLRTGAPRLGN